MRGVFGLAVAGLVALIKESMAVPIITVNPGGDRDLVITEDNTVNATTPAPGNATVKTHTLAAAHATEKLPLALVNNFSGGAINAYVTGLDSNNRLVILQPDGTFFYPTASSSIATPQPVNAGVAIRLGAKGSTMHITLPGYISSARIWFAEGDLHFFTVWSPGLSGPSLVEPSAVNPTDPSAAVSWGFVELTNNSLGGLYANISYVDFVGLVLGMSMVAGDGSIQTAHGLHSGAVAAICASLVAQTAKDGMPWTDLCQADSSGKPLRIVAPIDYLSGHPDAFADYFTSHIDDVWNYYSSKVLTIDTQAAAGKVACRVSDNELKCDSDNRGYARPTASDIFGCNSGPFAIFGDDNDVHRAIVPRLCAAFNRGTLISGGDTQPAVSEKSYYQGGAVNWYSSFVHEEEVDGRGYAFSYDDVTATGQQDQSGVVADARPQLLTVVVGGPLDS